MERVSISSCKSYDEETVYNAVRESIDRIGFELPKGKSVLIKPNIMSQNRPAQHTITHFSVVDAICRLLKEEDNIIFIGESIAFYQKGLTDKAFETSGIKSIANKYHASLIACLLLDWIYELTVTHTPSGVLISCATPATSSPSAACFSLSTNCS